VVTGHNNIAIGSTAGNDLTSGADNTLMGYLAGANITTASETVAIGKGAIANGVTTGSANIAVGLNSGYVITSGANNTLLGARAGFSLTTGATNTLVGVSAGQAIAFASGSNTTAIGNAANPSAADVSNEVTIGNTSVSTARIQVDWTILSDKRDKANIKPLLAGLDFVNDLKPVSFQWDVRESYCTEEEVVTEATFDEDGEELTHEIIEFVRTPTVQDGSKLNPNTTMGFLSQDVLETIEKFGEAATGDLILATNLDKLELQRGGLILPLVNAVKELSAKADAQAALIATLITRIETLEGT
jgi:hypothetical protein